MPIHQLLVNGFSARVRELGVVHHQLFDVCIVKLRRRASPSITRSTKEASLSSGHTTLSIILIGTGSVDLQVRALTWTRSERDHVAVLGWVVSADVSSWVDRTHAAPDIFIPGPMTLSDYVEAICAV